MEAYLEKFLQKFEHLKIKLDEIKSATNNFNKQHNYIGVGGFGKVYKGELSLSDDVRRVVAIKRLDSNGNQGVPEFLKEITMLSDYKHENLISLVGFCCEESEMILVYDLASHGSLDSYLSSMDLTWRQRLKICLDVAKGLSYLHDPRETHQRLIHCDMKSANILLDEQWNAKVSDFGLSTMGSANEEHSVIVTPAAGTNGYIDPVYWKTHTLTKESDVYSFGVVLLEVLCGRSCFTTLYNNNNGHVQQLVPTWKECYKQKKLNAIIIKIPNIQPLHQSVLKIFSDIAYRCLEEFREDRPKMAEVVTKLEIAYGIYQLWEGKLSSPPQDSSLKAKLCEGVLLNDGKTWLSLSKKGEHCEMISIVECRVPELLDEYSLLAIGRNLSDYSSRFAVARYHFFKEDGILKTHVKTQFLSPGITYTVNLVFKFYHLEREELGSYIGLRYKLKGERKTSVSHMAYKREDGWWMCELYQFTTKHIENIDLEILFEGVFDQSPIKLQGIEVQPLENVEHIDDKQQVSHSDSDANWEEKLPTDFEDIMKRSKTSLQWTTREEAYVIIRKGFLITEDETKRRILEHGANAGSKQQHNDFIDPSKNYEEKRPTNYKDIMKLSKIRLLWKRKKEPYPVIRQDFLSNDSKKRDIWFSLDKNGRKSIMLSARAAFKKNSYKELMPLPESRFGEGIKCDSNFIYIENEVESQLVSSETTYVIYLVYKFSKDQCEAPVQVKDTRFNEGGKVWFIYLVSPQTPVIRHKASQKTHKPLNRPKIKGLPQQRNDGWSEVQIWELKVATTVNMNLRLTPVDQEFNGLVIEGIECRPI